LHHCEKQGDEAILGLLPAALAVKGHSRAITVTAIAMGIMSLRGMKWRSNPGGITGLLHSVRNDAY
jgi:hypothetical protein